MCAGRTAVPATHLPASLRKAWRQRQGSGTEPVMSSGRRTLWNEESSVCRAQPRRAPGEEPRLSRRVSQDTPQRILSDKAWGEVREEEPRGGGTATPAWNSRDGSR